MKAEVVTLNSSFNSLVYVHFHAGKWEEEQDSNNSFLEISKILQLP